MVPQRTDTKAELPGCLRMAVECLQGWAVVMHLQTLWELENKAGIALGLCAEAAACSERAVPFSAFISQPGQLLLLVFGSVGAHQGCGNICNELEFRDGFIISVVSALTVLHASLRYLVYRKCTFKMIYFILSKAFLFSFQTCSINVKVIWLKSEMAPWKLIQTC